MGLTKRILICLDWFYPAYQAGGPVVSIMNLADQFSEGVYLFILCSDSDLNTPLDSAIQRNTWVKYNDYTSVYYWSKKSRSIRNFKKIQQLVGPDVIFINGIYSLYLNIVPLLFSKSRLKILSPRGMLHFEALQQKKWKKKVFLLLMDFLRIGKRLKFHATTLIEEAIIKRKFGVAAKVNIAVNFPRILPACEVRNKQKGRLKLVTIALISNMKNHLQVIKALHQIKGDVFYNIFGPIKDEAYWKLCEKEISMLPKNIQVQYHGDAKPENIASILSDNDVFIQPSESENFGHSLFEALSAGKPLITSESTPWNGLKEAHAGVNVNPNDINAIKEAIVFFEEMDEQQFPGWQRGASAYSKQAINLTDIINQYKSLFEIQ